MITSPIHIFLMRRKSITLKSRKTLHRLITTSSVYGTKTSKKMMSNITYSTYRSRITAKILYRIFKEINLE